METATLRLPADLLESLDALAEQRGFSSRSELIRVILRSHVEGASVTDSRPDIEALAERVDELESRLDRREAATVDTPPHPEIEQTAPVEDGGGESAEPVEPTPEIEDVLADWRPGRSTERREERRRAGRATLEFLRDRGVASASEFREHVEPEHPVSKQSPSTWWKKTGREALKRAEARGLVAFDDGRKEWKWNGG